MIALMVLFNSVETVARCYHIITTEYSKHMDYKLKTIPIQDVADLPQGYGIYVFRKGKDILYIGKSINIRARVRSHIENAKIQEKEHAIVSQSTHVDYYTTNSEFQALVLESRLIQKHEPRYNVRWRDDKSYLYIKVTVDDTYPRVFVSRRERDGKSLYFGPFPSMRIVREILKEIRRIVPFCTCKQIKNHTCMYVKMHQCYPVPYEIEALTDKQEHKRQMRQYKHNIKTLIRILDGDVDILLKDIYVKLDTLAQDENAYEEAIELRNKIHRFEYFLRGNIYRDSVESIFGRSEEIMESLHKLLLPYFPDTMLPLRVECYDISNLSFKEATASMVVATDGVLDKSQYRRFRIKQQGLESDFEMLNEVIQRRLKRDWVLPQLFVVDGGKPQVRTFMQVLAEHKVGIPLIGIAKRPDRIVMGVEDLPTIHPAGNDEGFNLVRFLRDEAHRFAKKYHTLLRNKRLVHT